MHTLICSDVLLQYSVVRCSCRDNAAKQRTSSAAVAASCHSVQQCMVIDKTVGTEYTLKGGNSTPRLNWHSTLNTCIDSIAIVNNQ
jgi:hypothetical protein